MKIGYLVPEFPGQTHIFFWREIMHLRQAGVDVNLFSTRLPPERDLARHAFAETAIKQTTYLWPQPLKRWLSATMLTALRHPIGFLKCAKLVAFIPIDRTRVSRKRILSLLIPACILARETERRGITHLHTHSCANSAVIALLLKRLNGIPYSMTVHSDLSIWKGALSQKLEEAEFNMVITDRLLEEMAREYPGVRSDQRVLGRMGVDTRKWLPTNRGEATGAFHIVSVSRLHVAKGQDVLLRAVGELVRSGRDITVTLMGDGPQRQQLETLTRDLGIEQRIIFAGSVAEDRIIQEMNLAHAFVLASNAEPLGVAYMEGMAMELPTIGTRAGGVMEIITDGVDGLLVEPRDEKGLAQAIAKLMDDPALRLRLAKNGRQTIVTKFDSRVGAEALLRCLKRKDNKSIPGNGPAPVSVGRESRI